MGNLNLQNLDKAVDVSLASSSKIEIMILERICEGVNAGLKVEEIEGKGPGVLFKAIIQEGGIYL